MSRQIDEVMELVETAQVHRASRSLLIFDGRSRNLIDAAEAQENSLLEAIRSKLSELIPQWKPIESVPVGVSVLACNSLGYVGRAVLRNGKWEGIGNPNGWMQLPKAQE